MKKLLLSLVLIFFLSLSFFRIYAISEDLETDYITNRNRFILVKQNLESEEGKNLVPKGVILGVNDTEEIVFTYIVFVEDGIKIDYYIENIKINNEIASEDIADLFEFSFEIKAIQFDSIQTEVIGQRHTGFQAEITLTLTMESPSEEQFYLIANQELSFEVLFKCSEELRANII